MTPIRFYFDTVSPFAYLALPGVARLAARRPVECHPVVLGAILAHHGSVGPAELAPKRLHTYRLCQFLAARAGRPFRFPPRHPFRSLGELRLLTALGAPWAAVTTVFDAIWAEGRDAADAAVAADIAARLGVADPAALIAETDAATRLRAVTDAAAAQGVFGVPTLEIDGELFWGLDALPLAEAYLDDPGLFEGEAMRRLATLPVGATRAPRAATPPPAGSAARS